MFPITFRIYDQIVIKQDGQNNQNIIEYFSQWINREDHILDKCRLFSCPYRPQRTVIYLNLKDYGNENSSSS